MRRHGAFEVGEIGEASPLIIAPALAFPLVLGSMTAGGVREFREKLVQWNRAAKLFYKASKAIAAPTIAIVTGDPHPHIRVG